MRRSCPGSGDRFVVDLLRRTPAGVILALNKVDDVHKPKLLPLMEHHAKAFDFRAIVPISALTGDGVEALEREILTALPDSEALYPDDYLTDQTERGLAAELIREKVLAHTREELPYTTAVLIDRFEEATDQAPTRIFASILVDQESQKPIVVGRQGEMIKRIGTEARRDLETMLDGRVYLDLHVKVASAVARRRAPVERAGSWSPALIDTIESRSTTRTGGLPRFPTVFEEGRRAYRPDLTAL